MKLTRALPHPSWLHPPLSHAHTGLPELEVQEPDTHYPLSITLPMLGMTWLNLGLFAYTCWLTFRVLRWAFALFGPAQPLALAAAAAYLVLSFWLYSQPVNALKAMQTQRGHPGKLAQSEANLAALDNSSARKDS